MSGHQFKFAVRRLAAPALAATLALGVAPSAFAQGPTVTYPPSRALPDISAWLQRDTPILPSQVVDVSPTAVTAITSAAQAGEARSFSANISSEAMDPSVPARQGIVAWSIPVEVDCERRNVRLGAMTGYPGRDLRSDPRVVRPADTTWVTPTPIAPLGAVVRALCDRDFRRPLGGRVHLATKTPDPAKATTAKATAARETPALPALRPTLAPPPVKPAAAAPPPATPASTLLASKPKPTPASGSVAVQIGASPSLPDIQGLLARFKKKFASSLDGLDASVATVQVEGKTVNRALISGFGSTSEASAFCKTLEAAGQACFVRR